MPLRLILAVLCGAGCGSASPDLLELHGSESPMVYGSSPSGARDSAVAALLVVEGTSAQPLCSGTLIGPRTVLTAAHCLISEFSGTAAKLFFGDVLEGPLSQHGEIVDVVSAEKHPEYNDLDYSNDIALIELASRPTNVLAIPHLSADRGLKQRDVGASIRMLGFGLTEDWFLGTGPAVTKQRLEFVSSIMEVCAGPSSCGDLVAHAFIYNHADGGPCSGDSGGPALIERDGREYVAGVTSTIAAPVVDGTDQANCMRVVSGIETTVDDFDTFIDNFVSVHGLAFDACALGNNDCDTNASCEDTHGAYYCTGCQSGFDDVKGDGTLCVAPDEEFMGSSCATATPPAGPAVFGLLPLVLRRRRRRALSKLHRLWNDDALLV